MDKSDKAVANNFYYDRNFDKHAAKILPGQYYVTASDILVVTVLGSCVAACIRDQRSGIGGMNHFMLPQGAEEHGNFAGSPARYGVYAMEVLINELLKLGAQRSFLEAKVFGGGKVIANMDQINVGEQNANFVMEFLSTESIPIVAGDLLDIFPRKVYFEPRSGKVRVKKLRDLCHATLVERESDYAQELRTAKVGGDIELFK
jgi:chemotaxis protein CheD